MLHAEHAGASIVVKKRRFRPPVNEGRKTAGEHELNRGFKLCGQLSMGPRGVPAQRKVRMSRAASLSPGGQCETDSSPAMHIFSPHFAVLAEAPAQSRSGQTAGCAAGGASVIPAQARVPPDLQRDPVQHRP